MARLALNPSDALVADSASPIFRVPALEKIPFLVHAITRRTFQDGATEFDLKRGDATASRALFARYAGIGLENTVWLDPDESGGVRFVSEEDRGRGAADWNTRVRAASGMVTHSLNLFLCTLYNDNVVVLIFDPQWYGVALVNIKPGETYGQALGEAVELMVERCGAKVAELTALIGPCMGPCCHTFPDPAFADARGLTNLWDLARGGLMKAGVPRAQILNPRACTACRDTEFFSRKVDGADGGAGGIGIGVRDDASLRRQLQLRRMSAKGPAPAAQKEQETRREGLLEEERRLNALMRCPYGQKKVYVRSVFDGQSAETTQPEIALRCAVMREMGHAVGGHNVVTREYIVTVCCGDYSKCPTYQELARRQRR